MSQTIQCTATTKKGVRCLRSTKNGAVVCFQHNKNNQSSNDKGKKLRLKKADCIGAGHKWIVGDGCFEVKALKSPVKITPPNIQSLNSNEVFVFGSNLGGKHGSGAARTALKKFGAVTGVGYGLTGQSFALPTKSKSIKTLPVNEIKKYVDTFYDFVKSHPHLHFLITEVGCGLANYKHSDIAPLFKKFVGLSNVSLPLPFIKLIVN